MAVGGMMTGAGMVAEVEEAMAEAAAMVVEVVAMMIARQAVEVMTVEVGMIDTKLVCFNTEERVEI